MRSKGERELRRLLLPMITAETERTDAALDQLADRATGELLWRVARGDPDAILALQALMSADGRDNGT